MAHEPTTDAELNAILADFADSIRSALQNDAVAAYLHGSFALGEADRHSDVDFLIVTRDEILPEQLQTLQTMHARIHDLPCGWAKHLEGSYFPSGTLNRPESVGVAPLWYLGNGDRALVRHLHCNTWVTRWLVRERGIPLFGPEPKSLFDPIPPGALRAEALRTMRDWWKIIRSAPEEMNNRWYQPYAVLSYCRMMYTLETGAVCSKPAAARWAQRELDSRWAGLIQRACDERPQPSLKIRQQAALSDFMATQDFIRYALEAAGRGIG